MQCIRCGQEVQSEGRMLVTADGAFGCPSSLPGEAAVHRVDTKPPVLAKRGPGGPGPVLQGLLGFVAGRFVGNMLFGGAPKPAAMPPLPPGSSPVEQAAAYFQSRQGT